MTGRRPRYSKEEHARRGTERYERNIRPQVETTFPGRVVVFDIDSGAFEVADATLTASQSLLARQPDAQIMGHVPAARTAPPPPSPTATRPPPR